ncbi:MAG: rRNA adenine N-6-methyltransferase family protein, partial [Planctomycetota bacterium]
MSLFKRHGLHPRTDLGQNFLIDLNILDFVVREAHLEKERDVVLEVGAGTAGMTSFLSDGAAAVVSVEVDGVMHRMATDVLTGRENVTLLRTDALKNKNQIAPIVIDAVREQLDKLAATNPDEPPRLKLVANLPYNIATPLISNLAGSDLPWSRMVAMIQYELAQRMCARPGEAGDGGGGGGSYGALSAWIQNLA